MLREIEKMEGKETASNDNLTEALGDSGNNNLNKQASTAKLKTRWTAKDKHHQTDACR